MGEVQNLKLPPPLLLCPKRNNSGRGLVFFQLSSCRKIPAMRLFTMLATLLVCTLVSLAAADEPAAERTISLSEGKIKLQAPEAWTKKAPRSKIIEAEYAITAAKGDEQPGRMTAMGAGGAVEDNIKRWAGQFSAPGAGDVQPKIEKMQVGGQDVHWVDLSGTYQDAPTGPFAGGKVILRENYRMLGVIIEAKIDGKTAGNYFLKFYGPAATVTENEKAFKGMVESLVVKK